MHRTSGSFLSHLFANVSNACKNTELRQKRFYIKKKKKKEVYAIIFIYKYF